MGCILSTHVDRENLTVTKATEWHVAKSAVQKAFEKAHADYGTDDLGIVFLLAKGVNPVSADSDGNLTDDFKGLLNPTTPAHRAALTRLERLMRPEGDTTFTAVPDTWPTFPQFLERAPVWGKKTEVYIFHVDNDLPLPQRCQQSGNCYMHAPEVLQHYLVSRHAKGLNQSSPGMIDMTKTARQYLPADEIRANVFKNFGGSSLSHLRRILEENSEVERFTSDKFAQCLRTFGPGLVSNFEVFDSFSGSTSVSFDGAPVGKSTGFHAMVLIGFREDLSGKRWCLLQNWWSHSQFVEVSVEYLAKCGGQVTFVTTPQTKIPEKFPSYSYQFAEGADKPEQTLAEVPTCPLPVEALASVSMARQ